MARTALNRLLLAAAVAPLALGLAACKKEADGTAATATSAATSGVTSAAPLPTVPPPPGKTWADVISKTPEGGYRMGNPDAPIKLVEYGSLTCPHCAEFSQKSSATIRDKYVASGRVSFEFRNFVRDSLDVTMAMLTRCGQPESFFALTEQVFANQPAIFAKAQANTTGMEATQNLPKEKLFIALGQASGVTEFFSARGISVDQANICLAKTDTGTQLAEATQTQGAKYQIEGTPTFLINDEKLQINTWEDVKARLEGMGVR
jgi:protein-disulfide isomerase